MDHIAFRPANLHLRARPTAAGHLDDALAMADFDTLEQWLHTAAVRVDVGDPGADAALQRLLATLQGHPDPRCTGLAVFASALAQRLDSAACAVANLYLRRFEVPQIELFNLLGRHVPLAGMATRIANDSMAQAIAGQAHPTLIDVGIGTGRQIVLLLADLASAGRLPQALTVIGIEPSASALDEARRSLESGAARLGVALHFHGIAASVEALGDADWQAIAAACSTRPVINASFALHHIADDAGGGELRSAVLSRLHRLDPRCFVLSEPDVDHVEPRFLQRFRNCHAHFSAVFRVLDALPLAQGDRDALKVGFFGREIHDILGTPEPLRSERHEAAAAWLRRLRATGFSLRADMPLPASGHASVTAARRGDRVAIQAGDESVVSVFVAAA